MTTSPTAKRAKTIAVEVKKEEAYDSDDDKPFYQIGKPKADDKSDASRTCPYLGTIDRSVLDFDFEKLCSVSLSHLNVYACLVCGKYFQGRGNQTFAYTHTLDTDHRVFLNLNTLKFYCLPDDYEIVDSALDDIKYVARPTYTKLEVQSLDKRPQLCRIHDGSTYRPGVVGLNNIKANDYSNVVLHALISVKAIRDYFLRHENYAAIKRPPGDKYALLVNRFGELTRKLWNARAFKTHVSPHEILQAVVIASNKRLQITQQSDAIDMLSFMLNSLHEGLNGTSKTSSSIVFSTFRGRMLSHTRKVLPADIKEHERRRLEATPEYKERSEKVPFLYLTLDLPPAPLYRDELMQNIIPQVPLSVLLHKFDGSMQKEYKTYNENFLKRFSITDLPPYLIIYFKRFVKNQFFTEKNPTIVNFPIKNVDLYDCLEDEAKGRHPYTTYDLMSNIVHDGEAKADKGTYRVQTLHTATGKWYELEDLHVKEILPQMITLTESYIQVWKLNRSKTREQRAGEINEDQ